MEDRRFDMREAFGREDFRVWVEGLRDTLGISVLVVDRTGERLLFDGPHGPHCEAAIGEPVEHVYADCFDERPALDRRRVTRAFCRATMPCFFAPVVVHGRLEAYVMIQGFVTSTRERRRLFELLVARGVSQTGARTLLRDLPVYSNATAERFAGMVAAHAAAIVEAARAGATTRERIRRLEEMLGTGRMLADAGLPASELHGRLLDRAMSIFDADDGVLMILRPGTDLLEIVAVRGEGSDLAVGSTWRVGDAGPGRVARSGRPTVAAAGAEDAVLGSAVSVCAPLRRDDAVAGVIALGYSDGDRGFDAADIAALADYAGIAAEGVALATRRSETQRDLAELHHINEFSQILQRDLGVDELVSVASSVLEKGLDFEIGGVVLTGHASDRASVVVRAAVTQGDLDAVFDDACGLQLAEVRDVTMVTHLGEVTADDAATAEWTVLSVPLTVRDVGVGYLFAASSRPRAFDAASERLVWRLASQVAPAFDRATLFERLRDDYARTIAALSAALDAGERRDSGHSARVMDYAMAIGEQMGLRAADVELLRFAGLLHDIGKVGVSEEILLKPSKLTDDEMARARAHAQLGATLVEQVDFLNAIAPIILHHHERWDGQGYPMRLVGDQSPLLARILAVADAYDCMTVAIPYRRCLSRAEAEAELKAGAGTQFDPAVVDAMLAVLHRHAAAGLTGMLSETARRGWLPA